MNTLLHWYRNDLRSEDHAALAHAAANGMKILPLYILPNEEMFRLSDLPRLGKHRKHFLHQTLKMLIFSPFSASSTACSWAISSLAWAAAKLNSSTVYF